MRVKSNKLIINDTSFFLSIIICTKNRADELKHCLRSVIDQAKEFADVEVIVVDNGSIDNTKQIVESLSKGYNFKVRYVFEPIPGICYARNRGAEESLGNIIAYIDDDIRLRNNWVANVRNHFIEKRSDCLGGKISIKLEGTLPFKLDQDMRWFFMELDLGNQMREFQESDRLSYPSGGNMAFHKNVFDVVGGFNKNLNEYGADETEFFQRTKQAGFKAMYDPTVEVLHYIPAKRLTIRALKNKAYALGKGSATLWLLSSPQFKQKIYEIVKNSLKSLYFSLIFLTKPRFGIFLKKWYYFAFVIQLLKPDSESREINQKDFL